MMLEAEKALGDFAEGRRSADWNPCATKERGHHHGGGGGWNTLCYRVGAGPASLSEAEFVGPDLSVGLLEKGSGIGATILLVAALDPSGLGAPPARF